jgi:steroid delta-isomerase-like uncharacterized protein
MSSPNAESSRRWFEEVWNQRQSATIDELLTPESVGHMQGGDVHGIDAFKRIHAVFLSAFPDLRVSIEAIVAEGDDVVIRWRASGRHSGDGFGVPATQQPVSFHGMTWHRYRHGKLVEGWDAWDQTGMIQHLRDADQRSRTAGGREPA